MSTDHNLLFGVLALQANLLDPARFAAACTAWVTHRDAPLADLLVQRGWLGTEDRARVDDLLRRHEQTHEGGQSSSQVEATTDPDGLLSSALATTDQGGAPTAPSAPPGRPLPSNSRGRYTLTRLHAHGAIGQVWLAHDPDLGRDVALKELRPERHDNAQARARFLEEARITGQLEHPGIVPVHELVRGEDGRPFYTMRMVGGRTLAEGIRQYHHRRQARQAGPLELRALLGAFVTVCNTVAYAHSRGVLHRDLKPANVVLGDFGEVVVLDWGLAKVAAEASRGRPSPEESAPLRPVALEGDSHDQTVQGQVLGTPAYMAPEQAEGRLDQLGPATDVYGLGAILYELLTGQSPFSGGPTHEVLRRVAEEEPVQPRQHVAQAPAALEAVCLKALAKKPADRYASAAELATEVERWLADEPVRAWREPLRLRAGRWVRRHQPLVAALAAALFVVLLLGGAGAVWLEREQQRQRASAEAILQRVAALERAGNWAEARSTLEQAEARLAGAGPADLRRRMQQVRDDLELVAGLDAIRMGRTRVVASQFDHAGADPRYAEAFANAGLGAVGDDEETVARRVADSAVREALVAALDDWASATDDRARRAWVLGVARRADPHPWRDRLRDPAAWDRPATLARLGGQAPAEALTANLATAVGKRLARAPQGETLLRAAQETRPGDFWLNNSLAGVLATQGKAANAESYYRAALAVRPDNAVVYANLGVVLGMQARWAEAEKMYRRALDLEPGYTNLYNKLGAALDRQGKWVEAEKVFRLALEATPRDAIVHYNLALALHRQDRWAEAEQECLKAIALNPKHIDSHTILAEALVKQGRRAEAEKRYRRIVALEPRKSGAHAALAFLLFSQGKWAEAETRYRQFAVLEPNNPRAHHSLGMTLERQRKWAQAETSYRRVVDLLPRDANAQNKLGCALAEQGKLAEAEKRFRLAISLNPRHAWAHTNLGEALQMQGQWAEAEKQHRRALALDPRNGSAHANLGFVLQSQGRWAEAAASYQKALDAQPNNALARSRLPLARRLGALEPKLPAVLAGKVRPDSNEQRLDLAMLCRSRRLYRAAAGLYADAKLAGHHYAAACTAALAGCGKGEDAGTLDDQEKARLRTQALGWLRAELAVWTKRLDSGKAADRAAVLARLKQWHKDDDLAGVRDPAALAKLPAEEGRAWGKLWAEVGALLARAGARR
jgi:serine/threonine-protein kinase